MSKVPSNPAPASTAYGPSTVKRARRTASDIADIDTAILSIVEQQRPMTVRQTFYQTTVRGLVPKDEKKGYRVIQRRLVALRESGRMPYRWITDNIRWVHGHQRYGGIDEFVRDVSSLFRRDYWRDAAVRVEIWIEKDALASVISPVVIQEWGLNLHVARGFSSQTYLHQAAEELARDGRPAHIYTLTDLDPSGIGIAQDIEAKLKEMVRGRAELHVQRLAVDPWQIEEWDLPSRPTKQTDRRAPKYRQQYGDLCVELDAIPPNTLRRILSEAIARHTDPGRIEALRRTEALERESIASWQSAFGDGT